MSTDWKFIRRNYILPGLLTLLILAGAFILWRYTHDDVPSGRNLYSATTTTTTTTTVAPPETVTMEDGTNLTPRVIYVPTTESPTVVRRGTTTAREPEPTTTTQPPTTTTTQPPPTTQPPAPQPEPEPDAQVCTLGKCVKIG